MRVKMKILGGPEDGGEVHMPVPEPSAYIVQGSHFVVPVEDGEDRTGLKIYHYLSDPGRRIVRFQGEEVYMHDGGDIDMGFKKHGTGQVIETEAEQDLSKTASQDWKPSDEQALDNEGEA